MEVKTNLVGGDRASSQTQSQIRAGLAGSDGRRGSVGKVDGSSGRAAVSGDDASEAHPKPIDELADRVRLIATAMANRQAAASRPRDSAAAEAHARLASTQIRDLASDAWIAQANISPRLALSLLSE